MKWSLASGVAVGLAGCAIPPHQALVSQINMPEYRLPGVARWFATTCQECEGGCGVSVRVMDGRAKKIEGIPEHPVSHGKVCARSHSALQALYNPDRLTTSWQNQGGKLSAVQDQSALYKALGAQLDAAAANKGSMLWITPQLGGSKGALIAFLAEKAGAKLWVLDFPGDQPERVAMKSLTGKAELPYYPLQDADYVVTFGSDFLVTGRSMVHDAWQYGEFRQGNGRNRRAFGRGTMVSFAARANSTVANSDKWIPVNPGTEGWAAMALGNLLAESKKGWPGWASGVSLQAISQATGVPADIYQRVAARLKNARKPLAIAGAENGLYTNGVWSVWMIQNLNRLLSGKVESRESSFLIPLPKQKTVAAGTFTSSRDAVAGLQSGKFHSVWVFDTNPRYLLPGKLNFDALFAKAKNKVVFTPYLNETAQIADWIVATQSWLEEWGDRRIEGPYGENGKTETIYNLQQPVAGVPDWAGSASLADALLGAAAQSGALKSAAPWDSMQAILKSRFPDEETWEKTLVRGGVWDEYPLQSWELYLSDSTHPLYPPPVVASAGKAPGGFSPWEHLKKAEFSAAQEPKFTGDKNGQVLIPFYSNSLGDGKYANRPWMQELPDVLASTVWTHWVELPVKLARTLGAERGDVIQLTSDAGTLTGPAFINPGLQDNAVAVPVGQGHTYYGQYADRGANPLSVVSPNWQDETGELAWVSSRVEVKNTGQKVQMTTLDTRMDRLPVQVLEMNG